MKFRRITALLLALAVVVCALPALAENVTMYVIKNTMQVYAKASSSSEKMCVLSYGDAVTVVKYNSSWAQLTNSNGDTGYCRTYQLSEKNPNVSPVNCYATSDDIPALASPAKSAKQLGSFDCGDVVSGVAVTSDKEWLRIEYDGGFAYVQAKYFSLEAPQETMTVYVKSTAVTLRHTASDSSAKTGSAYFAEEFSLTRLNGSWGYITNGIVSGWCRTSGLSTKSLVGSLTTCYASKDGVKVYSRSGKSLLELESLKKDDTVAVAAYTPDGKFALVECEDAYGYIEAKYLVASAGDQDQKEESDSAEAPESITVYVKSLNAAAYKSASASSTRIGTVSFGETLTCTAVDGSWALVSNSAGQGWVKKSALTTKDPNGSAKTYYGKSTGAVVYARPASSAKELGKLNINAEVSVVATSDGWYRVEYSGGYGYMQKSALTSEKPEAVATVYVRYNVVEAYKSASSSSSKVCDVYYGQQFTRLTTSREWALISNGSAQAWVKKDALTTTDPNTYNTTLYIKSDSTVVRKAPYSYGKKLTEMDKGDVVKAVAITSDGEWVRISYNDSYAYIAADLLTTDSPAAYTDPYVGTANETIEKVIALAIKQYGKPYVYAKEGPDSFDCSGLMVYCFEKCAGITLRRSGHDQGYDDRFARITSIAELKRGDVVVFDTIEDGDDLSDHTGIYLGGGLFLHASSSAGKVVVSNLSSGYYARKFSWGLRVIE